MTAEKPKAITKEEAIDFTKIFDNKAKEDIMKAIRSKAKARNGVS